MEKYFFIVMKNRALYLVCRETILVLKDTLQLHYSKLFVTKLNNEKLYIT